MPLAGNQWSMGEIAGLVHRTGMRGESVVVAVAVAYAESGGYDRAYNDNGPTRGCPNGSRDRGLWQINSCYHSEVSNSCAYTPKCAAYAMARISGYGRSFTQWATYNSGSHKRYLAAARHAYRQYLGKGPIGDQPPFPGQPPERAPRSVREAAEFAARGIAWLLGWVRNGVVRVAEGAAGFVRNWALRHIRAILHHAHWLLRRIRLEVARRVAWVRALLHKIDVTARRLRTWAGKQIASAIVLAVARATRWVRDKVLPWVRALVVAARLLARTLVNQLARWTRAAVDRLGDRIAGVLAWAASRIGDLRDLIRAVRAALIDWARDAVEFVRTWAGRIIGFFTRAAGWVAWLIANPITFFIRLWRDLAELTPRLVVEVIVRAVAREGDLLERMLARWLG